MRNKPVHPSCISKLVHRSCYLALYTIPLTEDGTKVLPQSRLQSTKPVIDEALLHKYSLNNVSTVVFNSRSPCAQVLLLNSVQNSCSWEQYKYLLRSVGKSYDWDFTQVLLLRSFKQSWFGGQYASRALLYWGERTGLKVKYNWTVLPMRTVWSQSCYWGQYTSPKTRTEKQ